ncbi:MAG TPA: matrixin family metalloprotease [Bdellovibrionota bacterium]|jgi:hypothetical protein
MLGRAFFSLLLFFSFSQSTLAYVRTMSVSGRPLFWPNPAITLLGNPLNSSGLGQAQTTTLLGNSFSAWQLPNTKVNFTFSQNAANPADSGINGINSIYFASAGGRTMEWGVVALTEVLYFVSNGQITEADMAFNDSQFRFTATEGDTGKSIGGRTAIYLPDVATHETGHVLGLDHGLVNNSSLIYTAFNGQFTPSNDDKNSILTIYPTNPSNGGALSGLVMGTKGGIFGAHLTAINLESGKVEAGILSGADGSFRIGDIPAGKYAVMMEPFGTGISSVSSYYKNVDHHFCGSSPFRRRFYSSCNSQGIVSVLDLSPGANLQLGTLAPSCSSMGNPGGPPNSMPNARELPNTGGAGWGMLRPGETHYYVVRGVSGQLSARGLSYSLYSPVDIRLKILDSNGNEVAGAVSEDNVQNPGPGGVINYDSSASANVGAGDYWVQVSSGGSRISASKFSAGYDLLDSEGHYLLALAVNGNIAPTGPTDMSSCVTVKNISQSASFKEYASDKDDKSRVAGCGSLNSGSNGPLSGGMMQVFLTALALHALLLAQRFRAGLVRKRR